MTVDQSKGHDLSAALQDLFIKYSISHAYVVSIVY